MDPRPSPDALLRAAAREAGRGRLKIFLGAAPGVGKTYEMLATARTRRREGVDVVVGIVETHGRAETAALLDGFEILPRRRIDYKGRVLEEMNLDALLARRPALALVDELAHSNAPGSRHPKRHLDVEELLAAGIDVYTTLNIQHVESLNDVVARITRIRVRETVPDQVLDAADDIEVIDLAPDDLLQRLREGKVYVAPTATRALNHYFSPGNLTALRELALRRTAQRVDAQLLDHMQLHAIAGPWAAGDRVLVCVTRRGFGAAAVRYGRRMAERLRAPWTTLHVETVRTLRLPEAARDRIAATLRLAESLGAAAVTIPGRDAAEEILDYARAHNFTHIVIGSSAPLRWRLWPTVAQRLIGGAGDIAVHVVGRDAQTEADAPAQRQFPALPHLPPLRAIPFGGTTAMVAVAVLLGSALRTFLAVPSIALVFLTAVLASAATWGLPASLYACVLSVLAYNFFFLPPLYTLTIADPENVVALVFFLIAAVIASNLASAVRAQAVAARTRARTTDELYQFSRKLAAIADLDDLLWAASYQVATMLKVRVVLLLAEGDSIAVRAGYPPEDTLDAADLAAARWTWQHDRPAGRDADTLPGARRLYLPLRTARGPVAVLGIERDAPGPLLTPDQRRLLDALADQTAVSIERITLADDVDRARLEAETEHLRGALLTSVSHDLRTPLAAILGAAGSLESFHELLDDGARRDLLRTIGEEAERMARFVANLLDMTRVQAGALRPQREPTDLGEVVGSTLARAAKVLAAHRVVTDLAPALPLVPLDEVLFEQALFNVLDNAAKYAPAGTRVTLRAWPDAVQREVRLQVLDEGPGIAADALPNVFEKFYRAPETDRRKAGTGLGLAIARGFVAAMGGRIAAANRTDAVGAEFTFILPMGPP